MNSMADSRSSTIIDIRERLFTAFATHLDMRPVRAGLQLDGSGGLPGWRVRHRRGPSALPAANEALSVIRECARRFPGGQMMFDLPTKFQVFPGPPPYLDHAAGRMAADAICPLRT